MHLASPGQPWQGGGLQGVQPCRRHVHLCLAMALALVRVWALALALALALVQVWVRVWVRVRVRGVLWSREVPLGWVQPQEGLAQVSQGRYCPVLQPR